MSLKDGELFFGPCAVEPEREPREIAEKESATGVVMWQTPSQQSYAAGVRFPQNIGSLATAPPNLQPSGMVGSRNVFSVLYISICQEAMAR